MATLFVTNILGFGVFLLTVSVQTEAFNNGKHVTSDFTKNGTRVTDDLRFLVVISRHGNRGGTKDYPFDPYPIDDQTYWPYGVNELTTHGRQEMHKLGAKVRSLYNGFLNTTYLPKELYTTSTDEDRTLMSAEGFLSGLYPPKGFQLWNKLIRWQPIPVFSNSSDKTPVIMSCPKFTEALEIIIEDFLGNYAKNISTMIKYFNKETGLNATGLTAARYLYHLGDKLISEATEGYKIPQWTKVLYPKPLLKLMNVVYLNYFAGSYEQVRLVIGTFFTDVLHVLRSFVDGSMSKGRRIHYYSGHDSTLVSLQVVFGISSDMVKGLVRPGSAIILELRQNLTTDGYYIEPLFIDGSTSSLNPEPLDLPQCGGTTCDFDTFFNITKPFTNVNFTQECQINSTSPDSYFTPVFNPFV